jgi:hypothetical protein
MTDLRKFCDHLIAFVYELAASYPDEPELVRAAQLAKMAPPRLLYSSFKTHIYDEFSTHILTENEEYIRQKANRPELLVFTKHWSSMSEANRTCVWKHLKVLVLLAQRVR